MMAEFRPRVPNFIFQCLLLSADRLNLIPIPEPQKILVLTQTMVSYSPNPAFACQAFSLE